MNSKALENNNCIVPGDLLKSTSTSFQVKSVLGEGAYGTVLKCVRVGGSTPYAIKVIKHRQTHHKVAKKEVSAERLCQVWSQDLEHAYLSSMNLCFCSYIIWPGYEIWTLTNAASSGSSMLSMTKDITAWSLSIWTKVFVTTCVNSVHLGYLWLPSNWSSGR